MAGRSGGVIKRLTPGLSSRQLPMAAAPCSSCLTAGSPDVTARQQTAIATLVTEYLRMVCMTSLQYCACVHAGSFNRSAMHASICSRSEGVMQNMAKWAHNLWTTRNLLFGISLCSASQSSGGKNMSWESDSVGSGVLSRVGVLG